MVNKGSKQTEEYKIKMRQNAKINPNFVMRGKFHTAETKLKISKPRTAEMKENLSKAHQREFRDKLSVHHVDYNKQNSVPDNLISLCRGCHIKTNKYEIRVATQTMLNEKIQARNLRLREGK